MTLSNKPVCSVINNLNQEELGSLLEACGCALRHNKTLSAALDEIDAIIHCLEDHNGDFNDELTNVADNFDLSLLAILTATKLAEITSIQGIDLHV